MPLCLRRGDIGLGLLLRLLRRGRRGGCPLLGSCPSGRLRRTRSRILFRRCRRRRWGICIRGASRRLSVRLVARIGGWKKGRGGHTIVVPVTIKIGMANWSRSFSIGNSGISFRSVSGSRFIFRASSRYCQSRYAPVENADMIVPALQARKRYPICSLL